MTKVAVVNEQVDTEWSQRGMWMYLVLCFVVVGVVLWGTRSVVLWKQERAERKIVCFGDSLTTCGAEGGPGGKYSDFLQIHLPEYVVLNKGVSGDTLAGGRFRFIGDVLELKPKPLAVIIELGANDFHQKNRPIKELEADLDFIVGAATDAGIAVVIAGVFGPQLNEEGKVVPKIYKKGASEFGRKILEMERRVAAKYGVPHIENIQRELNRKEHWSDDRHPSPEGNKLVAKTILPALQTALRKQRAAISPTP